MTSPRTASARTVYDDGVLLVVDKPHGLAVQADAGGRGRRAGADDLFTQLRRTHRYVGLHHRLDQPTSGLVLFTLDERANKAVAEGLRTHAIRRTYRAVLSGDVPADVTWDRPVDGDRAVSHVHVVGRGAGMTAVECDLETGRTHQIRVHAALAGRPVVGDRKYGGEAGHRWPRLALHAWRLQLPHPLTGEPLTFEAPLPDDLVSLWLEASGGPAPRP